MTSSIFTSSDRTLTIDFLVLPGFSLLSFASTVEPLRAANRVSGRDLYRWRIVSPHGAAVASSSGLRLEVDGGFDPKTTSEAVVVVAAFDATLHATKPVLAGLRTLARRGVALGGVESGPLVLAVAGLLSGRKATTHWEDLDEFAQRFPEVEVLPNRFVVDRDRFTTGGASPALDMMLDLIRSRQGHALALGVAGLFVYDRSHSADDPQASRSLGRLDWDEPRLAAAIRAMEAHIEEPLPVATVARRIGTGIRTLQTLFLVHVGMSPRAFYMQLRLEAARRMVLESRADMASLSASCGFKSASAFARAFRQRYGSSPSEARRTRRGA